MKLSDFWTPNLAPAFPGLKMLTLGRALIKNCSLLNRLQASDFWTPDPVPAFLGLKNVHFSTRYNQELLSFEQTASFWFLDTKSGPCLSGIEKWSL